MKTAFIAMLILVGSVSMAENAPDAQRNAAAHAAATAAAATSLAPSTALPAAPPVSSESKKNVCDAPTSESRSAVSSPASIY